MPSDFQVAGPLLGPVVVTKYVVVFLSCFQLVSNFLRFFFFFKIFKTREETLAEIFPNDKTLFHSFKIKSRGFVHKTLTICYGHGACMCASSLSHSRLLAVIDENVPACGACPMCQHAGRVLSDRIKGPRLYLNGGAGVVCVCLLVGIKPFDKLCRKHSLLCVTSDISVSFYTLNFSQIHFQIRPFHPPAPQCLPCYRLCLA